MNLKIGRSNFLIIYDIFSQSDSKDKDKHKGDHKDKDKKEHKDKDKKEHKDKHKDKGEHKDKDKKKKKEHKKKDGHKSSSSSDSVIFLTHFECSMNNAQVLGVTNFISNK